MKPNVIRVKRGDVGVIFTDTLTADGEPIDLTDATVLFVLRAPDAAAPALEAEAEIVDAEAGTVSYTSTSDDLTVAGVFRQEWEIDYDAGERFTVPSDGWNIVRVVDDLTPGGRRFVSRGRGADWVDVMVGVVFGVWIVCIVLSNAFGDNRDLTDDGAFLTAAGGIAVLLLSQRRMHRKVDDVYEHVNNVEESERVDTTPRPESLGSVLREVQRELRSGFEQNQTDHELIRATVESQGETIHDHGRRIDAQRAELNRLARRIPPR